VEAIFSTEITKIKDNKKVLCKDLLIKEIKLEIVVNGEKVGAVMATPVDQEALVIGYLMSENIIENIEDIEQIKTLNNGTLVEIVSKVNKKNIKKLNTEGVIISGCGKSITANIDPQFIEAKVIKSNLTIDASLLFYEMERFYTECPLYEQTGCVHTAKLYLGNNIFFIGEDIAQHNTIDKAIGKALLAGFNVTEGFLMVSGRLSSEMVAKAVIHQIPILASRTASTCLGVMIAKKFGVTLIGFVRDGRMNIYANEGRINV